MKKQTITIPKFTEQEQTIIASLQESRGITRKAALKYFNKNRAELMKGVHTATVAVSTPVETKPVAESKPEATSAPAPKTPAEPKPKQDAATTAANRKEGIRLFQLAGKPTKEQFRAVYGPKGDRYTWEQRAKLGVSAEQFQAALAAGKCVAPAEETNKKAGK